jgi:cytochrome b561
MSKPKPFKTDFRSHDRWLVISFAAGPLAALLNLTVSYFLTPESCQQSTKLWLHVSFGAFTLIALASAFIARRIGAQFASATPDPLTERTRWHSNAALVLSLSSVVLLIAMEIPNLILRSCD